MTQKISGSQVMSGFAKAATVTQISPLSAENWATADTTDQIILTMMKSIMHGAHFTATVDKAKTQLRNVLNTGSRAEHTGWLRPLKAPGAGGYPPQLSVPGRSSVTGPGFPPGPARARPRPRPAGQPAVRRPRSAARASLRLSLSDRPRASGGSRQIVLPPMKL